MTASVCVGPALEHVDWRIALYAVLSLTLLRMLPVAIEMLGSGAERQTVSFLGWFGRRPTMESVPPPHHRPRGRPNASM